MSLLAMALAAAVTAAPPPAQAQPAAPMPNFHRQPARCGPVHAEVVRQVRTASEGRRGAIYAVIREVDGCGVPAPMDVRQDWLAPGPWDPRPAGEPPRKR